MCGVWCVRDSKCVCACVYVVGRGRGAEGGRICRSISVLFLPVFIHTHTNTHTHRRIYAFLQFCLVHSFRVHAFMFSSAMLNVVIFPLHFYKIKFVCHRYIREYASCNVCNIFSPFSETFLLTCTFGAST